MNRQGLISEILRELKRQKKNRSFPDHVSAQAGVVTMEAGKIALEADAIKYGRWGSQGKEFLLREAAVRTAAAAIRLIESIDQSQSKSINDGKENHI